VLHVRKRALTAKSHKCLGLHFAALSPVMVTTVEKLEIVQAAKNKQIYDSDFSVQ
jgi:hypothetical protein